MLAESYSILADKGFTLVKEVMTPYKGNPHRLSVEKRKYNRHLNSKRQVCSYQLPELPLPLTIVDRHVPKCVLIMKSFSTRNIVIATSKVIYSSSEKAGNIWHEI